MHQIGGEIVSSPTENPMFARVSRVAKCALTLSFQPTIGFAL